ILRRDAGYPSKICQKAVDPAPNLGIYRAVSPDWKQESEPRRANLRQRADGQVAEWLKAHAWNACIGETLSRVRIPLCPPFFSLLRDVAAKSRVTPSGTSTNCCFYATASLARLPYRLFEFHGQRTRRPISARRAPAWSREIVAPLNLRASWSRMPPRSAPRRSAPSKRASTRLASRRLDPEKDASRKSHLARSARLKSTRSIFTL